jgi:hypothetical protein
MLNNCEALNPHTTPEIRPTGRADRSGTIAAGSNRLSK